MKTIKIWRLAFAMLAAFSLASCSSDDDTDIYVATELSGTWQKVYDEGVADAGMVQYTFHPQSANNGTVDIFTSDWAAGDTTVYRIYTVTDAGHLHISPIPDDTSVALTVDCDIRSLTSTQMIWNKPGTNEEISRFKKVCPEQYRRVVPLPSHIHLFPLFLFGGIKRKMYLCNVKSYVYRR